MTCPSCHQTIPDRVETMISPSIESRDDQIALIHRETRRLDQLIAHLNEERAALLRRLNTTQPPTAALPVETLSSIFEYACLPPGSGEPDIFPPHYITDAGLLYPQFILGAVSTHWHRVVRSTPVLWTWITLDIKAEATEENTGNVEERVAFLRHFIEHSKQLPFTLALNFSEDVDPESPHLVHGTIDNLLIEALPRIKELHLVNPPLRWLNYTPNLAQLRDFSLNFNQFERPAVDGRVTFPSTASLRRLSLREALWLSDANLQPPWVTLTLLHLAYIPPDSSVQVFVQCPNLVDFHCSSPSRRQLPLEQVTLTRPILFQHLLSFHWETDDTPWSRALVRYLHVPALKQLHWGTFHANLDNNDDVRDFFNRLPSTLETLVLDTTTSNIGYIRDDSNIRSLELNMCRTSHLRMLFQKLRPSQQDGQAVKPLPQLSEVILTGDLYDDNTMVHVGTLATGYSTTLVDILEQRLDESNGSFTLDMEDTTFRWRSATRAKLNRLINRGYTVNIMEGLDDGF